MSITVVYAPAYPQRTSAFVKESMSDSRACKLCNILKTEKPLVELEYSSIIETRFRSTPEHVMVLPKRHIQGIHETHDAEEVIEMFSAVHAILRKRKYLIAFGNYGIAAGQTIPHLHIHVMSCSTMGISNAKEIEIGKNTRPNDPLSEIIIFNSGYRVNRATPWIDIALDKFGTNVGAISAWNDICHLWEDFSSAFGMIKNGIYALPGRYRESESAKRRQMGWLMGNRATEGLGMIWCISKKDGGYLLRAAPRVTIIDPKDLTKTMSAPEIFYKTLYKKEGVPKEEEERWDAIAAGFHSEIKGTFQV